MVFLCQFPVADVFDKERSVINIEDFLEIDMDDGTDLDNDVIDLNVSDTSASTDDIRDEVISVLDSPILENTYEDEPVEDDVIIIKSDSDEVLDTITRFPTLGSMCGMEFDFESILPENLIYFGNRDPILLSPLGFKMEK